MKRFYPCMRPDWRMQPPHSHLVAAVTLTAEGHRHRLHTFVYAANGSAYDEHIHYFQGVTEKVRGHSHRFYNRTGPAIPLPDGSHYHTITDETYYNDTKPVRTQTGSGAPLAGGASYAEADRERHRHKYEAVTGRNFGEPPPGW